VTQKKVSAVVVAYPDRLSRFGFETFQRLCSQFGTSILATNREEKFPNKELAVYTSEMCSHKYNEVAKGARKLLAG
jgi:putative resolvase